MRTSLTWPLLLFPACYAHQPESISEIQKFALTSMTLGGTETGILTDINSYTHAVTSLRSFLSKWTGQYSYGPEPVIANKDQLLISVRELIEDVPFLRFQADLMKNCSVADPSFVNCYESNFQKLTPIGKRIWGNAFRHMIEDISTADHFMPFCRLYAQKIRLDRQIEGEICTLTRDLLRASRFSALKSREHSYLEGLTWKDLTIFLQEESATSITDWPLQEDKLASLVRKELGEDLANQVLAKPAVEKVKSLWSDLIIKKKPQPSDIPYLADLLTLILARGIQIGRDLANHWESSAYHKFLLVYPIIDSMIATSLTMV